MEEENAIHNQANLVVVLEEEMIIDREIATIAGETKVHVKETIGVLLKEDNIETKDVNAIDS